MIFLCICLIFPKLLFSSIVYSQNFVNGFLWTWGHEFFWIRSWSLLSSWCFVGCIDTSTSYFANNGSQQSWSNTSQKPGCPVLSKWARNYYFLLKNKSMSNCLELEPYQKAPLFPSNTVDGRNTAPVSRYFIPLFTGFYTSQVVQDFFIFFCQQYCHHVALRGLRIQSCA